MHNHKLFLVLYGNIVLSLVILQIGNLGFLITFVLSECVSKLDIISKIIDSVHFLIVGGHDSGSNDFILNSLERHFIILKIFEIIICRLDSQHFVGKIDIYQNLVLFINIDTGEESRPDF